MTVRQAPLAKSGLDPLVPNRNLRPVLPVPSLMLLSAYFTVYPIAIVLTDCLNRCLEQQFHPATACPFDLFSYYALEHQREESFAGIVMQVRQEAQKPMVVEHLAHHSALREAFARRSFFLPACR